MDGFPVSDEVPTSAHRTASFGNDREDPGLPDSVLPSPMSSEVQSLRGSGSINSFPMSLLWQGFQSEVDGGRKYKYIRP